MKKKDMTRTAELFLCICGDPLHHFVIRYLPSAIDGKNHVAVEIGLQRSVSFLRRLRNALRYLFAAYTGKDSNVFEVVLGEESASSFRRIADFLEDNSRNFSKPGSDDSALSEENQSSRQRLTSRKSSARPS